MGAVLETGELKLPTPFSPSYAPNCAPHARRLRAIHRALQSGLAFLSLMLAIVVIGIVATSALQWGAAYAQRDAEAQLLFVGEEIQQALARYDNATPVGLPRSPASLQELVRDPRYPGVVRHLRQLYIDPFTGTPDWAVIQDPFGRIVAVHSRSKLKPLKTTGFELPLGHLERRNANAYDEWLFWGPGMSAALVLTPMPVQTTPAPVPAPAPVASGAPQR
jgi:type II secretory pathway pseudopilin PulG